MESNKKFIFTLILIIIIIICLAGYYFIGMNDNIALKDLIPSVFKPKDNTTVNNTENNTVDNNQITSPVSFSSVKDYQIYFNINDIINKYYSEGLSGNYKQVLGMLDEYYTLNNEINGTNIVNYIKTDYQSITYYSKQMYVKSNDDMAYYFVSGEEQLYNFIDEILTEQENVAYMVIVDKKNDAYSITPLTTPSLFEYAQNYIVSAQKRVNSNAYNNYFTNSYTDETISSYYLNYYKTLLYLNSEKAYNMLDTEYKATFRDLEDFVNHLQSIYDKLNPKLLSYSVKGENGRRMYSVISENNVRVDMTENSILDFKISIK